MATGGCGGIVVVGVFKGGLCGGEGRGHGWDRETQGRVIGPRRRHGVDKG